MLGSMIRKLLADETGATAIEYGLLAGLIAVAAIASFALFGGSLEGLMAAGTGGAADVIAIQTAKIE